MPTAPRLETGPWQGSGWRAVEAQHKNATMALAQGRLADQALLEDIIEAVKPPLPATAVGLHFLLSTPFRYRSPPPAGSRFRARNDPGVFYGAEDEQTACAEAGYWRWRFWQDSAGLRGQPLTMPMTLFRFHGATTRCLDLTQAPLVDEQRHWTHPTDYQRTQALAERARQEEVELIRYASVRHAPTGRCLAVLAPAFFRGVAEPYRNEQQSWSLFLQPAAQIVWQRSMDDVSFTFGFVEGD